MTHAYTEDQLVEQPVTGLFAELGWTLRLGMQNHSRTRPTPAASVGPISAIVFEIGEGQDGNVESEPPT
jgi:hypothetical protein